jgi:hypothetical protein
LADPQRALPVEPIHLNDRRKAAAIANGIVSLYAARLHANRAPAAPEPRPVIRFGRSPTTDVASQPLSES